MTTLLTAAFTADDVARGVKAAGPKFALTEKMAELGGRVLRMTSSGAYSLKDSISQVLNGAGYREEKRDAYRKGLKAMAKPYIVGKA